MRVNRRRPKWQCIMQAIKEWKGRFLLRKLAKKVLLPFYDGLHAFFDDIFNTRSNYRYIVFIARRCSNLMEIFFKLRDDLSGYDKDKEDKAENERKFPPEFITDSALFSQVPGLAQYYRRSGRFPPVLIVDDIVIYGQGLDTFLRELEERLYEELKESGANREDIADALARAVQIRTFARNNQPLLLDRRYQSNFTAAHIMEPVEWRDLSNRISRLLLLGGQVNSCFVSGAKLDPAPEKFEALYRTGFSRIETTYDAFPETTFCRVTRLPGDEAVIYTVRLFSSGVDGAKIAAPFVFMPSLPERDMDDMFRTALDDCGLSDEWRLGTIGKCRRTKSEAFAFLLSTSLLNEFCRLSETKLEYNGEIKLGMNFSDLPEDTHRFVDRVLDSKAELLSLRKMDHLFLHGLAHHRKERWGGNRWAESGMQESGDEKLKERLEDEIYSIGLDHYARAYWETQIYQDEPSEKRADYFNTAPELFRRFSGSSKESLPHVAGWVLQMADAGILAITMREFSSGGTGYVGQCLKTGEQSQFIRPKRLRDLIPILAYIQRKAHTFNRDFEKELHKFAGINEDIRTHMDEIELFLRELEDSGQRLEDWDFDLITLPDSNSENWKEGMMEAFRSLRRKQRLMMDYESLSQA